MIETMNCPVCQQALNSTLVQSIPLDVCNVCGGIWLDRGELPKIALADISTLDLPMTHRNVSLQNQPKHCPRDQMPLRKKTFIEDQAVVDECPKCAGIWVDHLKEFLQVVSDFKQKKNLDRKLSSEYFDKEFSTPLNVFPYRFGSFNPTQQRNKFGLTCEGKLPKRDIAMRAKIVDWLISIFRR